MDFIADPKKDILGNLKAIRQSFGLSQIELAKKVGVSMLSLRLWEIGATVPKEENLTKLEDVIRELKGSGDRSSPEKD